MFAKRSRMSTMLWMSFVAVSLLQINLAIAEDYHPTIAPKSDDAERAIQRFKIPEGMTAELFAAEPMVANPVAFCFDEQGRIFVAETFRQQKGVEDNRGHANWLVDDLAAQTVADRIAYFKKHLKTDVQKYGLEHDRVRLLQDTDGDGRADKATIFADGFNGIEEGTGAGVLYYRGNVYYTCIPKLWLLSDTGNDGKADVRKPLHDGFGVRVAFRGHDLHGLIVGPDGRLYFSIGDRGYHVETPRGLLAMPDRGAVFRCNLDGSDLEVFATGLRNPQELAFDDFGNLFTCDNNSDGGDRSRWVYVVEGGDSGWRMYYQYIPDRGPWNLEKLWYPAHSGQAAYIVPPIINFADGPSGLAYYPGSGLGERYRGHFFLADFRGSAANSGIRSFSLIPNGASFELVDSEQFIWSILATDVDFSLDGGLYVSDWVEGWDGAGKGRIYRFRDQKYGKSPIAFEVERLIKNGFDRWDPKELRLLLMHPDTRIRQRAQFALVDKNAVEELQSEAIKGNVLIARIHAIWGLGQLARSKPNVLKPLLSLASDPQIEIRSQLARVCGDVRYADSEPTIVKLLDDPNPRIKALAGIAAGKLKSKSAAGPLFRMLAETAEGDPILRHSAVMGLVGACDVGVLRAASKSPSPYERMGAVLALRKLEDPGVSEFLKDPEPLIVLEAARAIHDVPINKALTELSKLPVQPGMSDPLVRRILNANYRMGGIENAQVVAGIAANPFVEDSVQLEAVAALVDWNSPPALDRLLNDYRPIAPRKIDVASVVKPVLTSLFSGSRKLRAAAAKLAGENGIADVEPLLLDIIREPINSSSERVAAIKSLAALKSPQLRDVVDKALKDFDANMRSEARRLLAEFDPVQAVQSISESLPDGATTEQQSGIAVLASLKREDADRVLDDWMQRLIKRDVADGIQLDLLLAAQSRQTMALLQRIEEFNATRKPDDPLREYRETLAGGQAERGGEIFFGRTDVSCRRCHKVLGNGGEVGPDLSRIGLDKTREYLLESIVDPSRQIAKGFETVVLQLDDGTIQAGIIKTDDGDRITLQRPDGTTVVVEKSKIEERAAGKSGMPEDILKKLSKSDIRDLVEFLAALKSTAPVDAHGKN